MKKNNRASINHISQLGFIWDPASICYFFSLSTNIQQHTMDIEPNAIFSDASEYAPTLSDERRESNMRVISFVNRGLMTQGR